MSNQETVRAIKQEIERKRKEIGSLEDALDVLDVSYKAFAAGQKMAEKKRYKIKPHAKCRICNGKGFGLTGLCNKHYMQKRHQRPLKQKEIDALKDRFDNVTADGMVDGKGVVVVNRVVGGRRIVLYNRKGYEGTSKYRMQIIDLSTGEETWTDVDEYRLIEPLYVRGGHSGGVRQKPRDFRVRITGKRFWKNLLTG